LLKDKTGVREQARVVEGTIVGGESEIVLRVCGRMHIECVNSLKELTRWKLQKTVLDLSEVTLADHDAATFLAACELNGIELRNWPHFFVVGFLKNRRVLGGSFAGDYAP
jgi:hypothetical protein